MSIKSEELMIGNWVECNENSKGKGNKNKIYKRIDWSHFLDGKEKPIPYIDPIPLTPDILEKCGFIKEMLDKNYWFEYFDEKFEYITNDNSYSEIEWHIGFREINSKQDYIFIKDCAKLHLFQNLHKSLTNKELNINL
jgi:hypothetical protein